MSTTAQRTIAAARREKMRALAQQIGSWTPEARQTMANNLGAVTTIEGRPLSLHNTLMVLTQLPGASIVGGFRQWLDAGRCVRQGEHGAGIWVPTKRKDEDGEEETKPGFVLGTVFDVSQTEAVEAKAAA